ncbi:MAG TPA: hypothetical protein VJH69_04155 [Candidatus Paceibacterota bacterium]
MIFALVTFYGSLLGIIVLFSIKYWEQRKQLGFAAPLRRRADERAVQIKIMLSRGRAEFAKLPVRLNHFARAAVHFAALETAHLARILEAQAHRLADFVSHKHHFEKSETKSEFLKKVGEHPIRNRDNNSIDIDK